MVLLISQYWRTPCTKDLRGSSLFFAKKRRGLACRLGCAVPLATGKHRPQTPQEKNLYVCFKTSIFTDERFQSFGFVQGLLTATPCTTCAAAADGVRDLRGGALQAVYIGGTPFFRASHPRYNLCTSAAGGFNELSSVFHNGTRRRGARGIHGA